METTTTPLSGLLIIKPTVFYDSRGYFFEPYNKQRFAEIGIDADFVQDNQSLSQIGAVRGLHFQAPNGFQPVYDCLRVAQSEPHARHRRWL